MKSITEKPFILKISSKYHTLVDFGQSIIKIRIVLNPEKTPEGNRIALKTNIPLYLSYFAMYLIWNRYYERVFGIAIDIIIYLAIIMIYSSIYFHFQLKYIFDPMRFNSESLWQSEVRIRPEEIPKENNTTEGEYLKYIGMLYVDYDHPESSNFAEMSDGGVVLKNARLTSYKDHKPYSLRWYSRFFIVAGITNKNRLFPVLPIKYHFHQVKKERRGFAVIHAVTDLFDFTRLVKEIYPELRINQNVKFEGGMLFNLMKYGEGGYQPVFVN